jgi:hypothetical protein
MNRIDQGWKHSKHITLETIVVITIHVIHLSFIDFDRIAIKSQINTSYNYANLFKQ